MNQPKYSQPLRLNRFLARAGLGSRRGVEELIRAGQVTINGETVTDLGRRVQPKQDTVAVQGQRIHLLARWRVYAFHKPKGVVSTLRSQGGQPCLELYRTQSELPVSVVPVGRLDAQSTGLLLWTDDGDLAQLLCRPASQIWKVYQVVLETFLDASARTDLVSGKLELDGRACLPLRIEMAEPADGRHLNLQMHEGRYRQIRRMFGQLGLKVVSLHRVQIGPIVMGRLKAGCFRRLTAVEESRLRRTAQNENQDSS